MTDTKKRVDPIPDEFATYEEAAEFWDTHDTTDYPEAFQIVDVQAELRGRYYQIEIDEDTMLALQARAKKMGVAASDLARDLLRQQVSPAA
jgi:hypothetical protein